MKKEPLLDKLRGTVDRITFQNSDTGYTVARLQAEGDSGDPVTIVGETLSLNAGESVVMEGEWTTHSQYGRQFKISSYQTVEPTTADGMRRYLGSGLIKGIGPVMAKRIVDRFGDQTLHIIEKRPKRLVEVEGLGRKRAEQIQQAWLEQHEIHSVMLFLQTHEVGTGNAVKIWKRYGSDAVEKIEENPYRLASDVWGIGFLTADRIAAKMGVAPESPQRIRAGLIHVLNEAASSGGHVFLPREDLVAAGAEALGLGLDLIEQEIASLAAEDLVLEEGGRIYLPHLYYAEKGTATRLYRLSQIARIEAGDVTAEIDQIEKRLEVRFAPLQKDALKKAVQTHLLVLTGGPGTGKTTTIRGLIALLEARKRRVALAAPTGRAAKRMSEATGRPAQTIHRLLEFSPQDGMRFKRTFENPLEIDALIVDEVSMVDVILMNSLLQAVPLQASVVLVGDTDQLPSVGPGNVLKDAISSGVVNVVALSEIFRQAEESSIVVNAHRMRAGEFPEIRNQADSDFFFIEENDAVGVAETIAGLCHTRLPKRYGLDSIEDIQVLTPMYRGETGVDRLNQMLQERLNPNGPSLQRGGKTYRTGDKVMQLRNNYDKDVFNGDVGRISRVDVDEQQVTVLYPGRESVYGAADLDEIVPAYAITVHKSQGSEYRAVVLPVTTQHYVMLQRNLIYTALTRARELAVLVGSKRALGIAIGNNRVSERFTSLSERLQQPEASRMEAAP
jgi:exodeoxyribonuclease V alpha subunit